MAFGWIQDVNIGASIDAADVNEIKDNLDSIYDDLSIDRPTCAGAGWSELPVSGGETIASAQFQELRAVTDYADDNKCPSDNTTYQSTEYTTEDTTVQSSNNAGVDGSYNGTVDSSYYITVYGSQNTYCSSNNSSVMSHNYNNRVGYWL